MASNGIQLTWRKTLFLVCSLGAFVAFFAFSGGALAMRETAATAPSVVSDQADYTPGSTVTLTGANWGAGEAVHIFVNDDAGQTWSHNADVAADDAGNFRYQFQLPNFFVADYSVTATGSSGATATTTFTDGNVSFALATADTVTPSSWAVNWTKYDDSTCTTAQSTGSVNPAPGNVGVGNNKSVRPTSVTAASGSTFNYWSDTPSGTTPSSNTCTPDSATPRTLYAHFMSSDSSPPVITKTISGTLGTNGWYTSNVSVVWTVTDSQSAVTIDSGCGTQNFTTETASTTSSCTAHSAGGSSTDSVTLKIDKTAPSASTALNRAPDHNGWYNHAVGWTTTGSDATSGIASCSSGTYGSPDGTGLTVSGSCTDNAGNASAAAASAAFDYDATAPTNITFSGIAAQTYPVADLPPSSAISCDANFAISGKDSCNVTGYGADFGSHTLTATAMDLAGNQGTSQLTYVVGLKCGDILAPVAPNSSGTAANLSAFKIKSVIPVKFRCYLDAAMTQLMTAPPAGSVAKLSFSKYDSTTETIDAVDFVSAGSANTDNIFRWTGSPDYQFIYTLATAGKAQGTYFVQMTLYAANGTTVLAVTAKQYFVLRP
jgi:hypothetical protein